jgi:ribose/xylose/arabinose/galactoside ABC-type transport system permease subunit
VAPHCAIASREIRQALLHSPRQLADQFGDIRYGLPNPLLVELERSFPGEAVMHRVMLALAILAVGANPAAAQSRGLYAAAVGGVEHGGPDVVQTGTISTAPPE